MLTRRALLGSAPGLLLSKSKAFPNGLSNNHGQVGRHYISHAQGGSVTALFPFDINAWYGLPEGPAHAIIATLYDIYCATVADPSRRRSKPSKRNQPAR